MKNFLIMTVVILMFNTTGFAGGGEGPADFQAINYKRAEIISLKVSSSSDIDVKFHSLPLNKGQQSEVNDAVISKEDLAIYQALLAALIGNKEISDLKIISGDEKNIITSITLNK